MRTLLWIAPVLLLTTGCTADITVFGGQNAGGDTPQPGGAPGTGGMIGVGGDGPIGGDGPAPTVTATVSSTSTGMECPSGPNDDTDGDGFSANEGDCNDCEADLSPNNLEVPGNLFDEDCDGELDNELEPCDENLIIDDEDPILAANAIELCRMSSDADHWGLVSAVWVLADGALPPSSAATLASFHLGHGLLEDFGTVVEPRAGARLLGLSSDHARDENDPDFAATTGGGKGYSSGFPGGLPLPSVGCPGIVSGSPQDPIALQVSVRVPDNAVGFSFDSNFYVRDWPQFVCSTFDDAFFAFVSPTPAGLLDGHVTFYGNGNPISLNGAPFDVCACKAPPCMAGGQTYACTQGNAALAGTGFTTNAATGWQTTTVSTVPGSEITLRLGVYDAGDGAFTATALVDAFTWSTTGVTVQTVATP